jgi:hypothetical protein
VLSFEFGRTQTERFLSCHFGPGEESFFFCHGCTRLRAGTDEKHNLERHFNRDEGDTGDKIISGFLEQSSSFLVNGMVAGFVARTVERVLKDKIWSLFLPLSPSSPSSLLDRLSG